MLVGAYNIIYEGLHITRSSKSRKKGRKKKVTQKEYVYNRCLLVGAYNMMCEGLHITRSSKSRKQGRKKSNTAIAQFVI